MPGRGKLQANSTYEGSESRWESTSVAQFFMLLQHKFDFPCLLFRDLEEVLLDYESFLLADTCA